MGAAKVRTARAARDICLGRPLGGCRSTYSDTRAHVAYACLAVLLCIATTLSLFAPAMAVEVNLDDNPDQKLSWKLDESHNYNGDVTIYYYYLVNESGEKVTSVKNNGKEIDLTDDRNKVRNDFSNDGDMGFVDDGVWAATKDATLSPPPAILTWGQPSEFLNVLTKEVSDKVSDATDGGNRTEANAGKSWDYSQPIRGYVVGDPVEGKKQDKVPTWGLTKLDNVFPSFIHWTYTSFIAPLLLLAAGIASWLTYLIDPTQLFTQPFSGGAMDGLYNAAVAVNAVATTYGKIFLGIIFVASLLDPGRPRAHDGTAEWLDQMLKRICLLMIAMVFIDNAMTVVQWIYGLAGNAIKDVNAALGGGGAKAFGDDLLTTVCVRVQTLTYNDFFVSIVLLFVLGGVVVSVLKCALKVLSIALLRAGEIYLRASLAAIPFAFLSGERQRQVGVNYLKRFCTVCFQSVAIAVALSFMSTMYSAAGTVTGALISAASTSAAAGVNGMSMIIETVKIALPIVVAVNVAAAIVDKSENVANGLFGAPM